MKKEFFILILIFQFFMNCNLDEQKADPCFDNFSWEFTKIMRQKYESLISSSMSSNYYDKLIALNCDTLNLMFWFKEDIGIEDSNTVNEIIELFFIDSLQDKIQHINLKLSSSFPETRDKYLKKATTEYSINRDSNLVFEKTYLKRKEGIRFFTDGPFYSKTYSDKKKNLMSFEIKVNKDHSAVIDFEVLSLIERYSKEIKDEDIDEVKIEVSVTEPEHKITKSKFYRYYFVKQNGHI